MILRGFDLSGLRFVVAMRLGKPGPAALIKSIASRRQSLSCEQGEWRQEVPLYCAGLDAPA
jgi:hypothetical protein